MYYLWAIEYAGSGKVINKWVKNCDVDAIGGMGMVEFTDNKEEAKPFSSAFEALEYWKRQSTVMPYRVYGDYKPNRPLTAITVTILQ